MKTYVVSSQSWKVANSKINMSAKLSSLYGIDKIEVHGDEVHLHSIDGPNADRQNSYGDSWSLLSKLVSPQVIVDVVNKSHDSDHEVIYVLDRFTSADDDNLIVFPLLSLSKCGDVAKYVKTFYKDKYDFAFSATDGFHKLDMILFVDEVEKVKEDISFLLLRDSDIGKIYEYKLRNMIPFEEYVSDEVLEKQGAL
jgi:hypothetical protein